MRQCEQCGEPIGPARRAQIRTCSTRCRVALHRARRRETAEPYPGELRERDRWVRRSAVKVPLRADGHGVASSTDPGTWSTYAQARRSTVGVGVGYVLTAADRIVCVDLDHCITGGQVAGWAQAILELAPATYVEVSASGTGLHIWGRGRVQVGRVVRDGVRAVEVYGTGRYIAMGARYADAPLTLADLTGLLATL